MVKGRHDLHGMYIAHIAGWLDKQYMFQAYMFQLKIFNVGVVLLHVTSMKAKPTRVEHF